MEEFPLGLNNLCVLEELAFSQCGYLRKIPEEFGGLTSLKKLTMQECEALEEFPLGLGNLCTLEELDFPHDYLAGWIAKEFPTHWPWILNVP